MPRTAEGREAASINITAELKCHLGEGQTAVLRFSEGKDAFILDLVLVPGEFRARGLGTALVERLLFMADATGKPVHTTARPIGRSTPDTLDRLVRYYERLGFQEVKRGISSVLMSRPVLGAR